MAKAQVTEEALAQGIQSLGGFGNLAAKPRRDSPFGSAFAPKKAEPVAAPVTQEAPKAAPIVAAPLVAEVAPPPPQPIAKQVEVISPAQEEIRESAPKVLKTSAPKKEVAQPRVEEAESTSKADEFTERITLQMTPEMRDKLSELARILQRSRREKGGRITSNTLMRVAIQSFIDGFDSKALNGVSSEEELLREVQGKRKGRV